MELVKSSVRENLFFRFLENLLKSVKTFNAQTEVSTDAFRQKFSQVYFNLKGKTNTDVKNIDICLEIFHFSTFYFMRYAQVKNQEAVKMFAYEYEKYKTLPTFQEKIKIQW